MKIIVLVVLSSVGLHGQWITGFWYSGPEPVSAIPWSKYTHVIHSTSQANSDGTIDWSAISPADTTAIVAGGHAAGRKVLWTLGDRGGAMASATSSGTIAAFVNNIVNFTNSHGYDGVDLDWESRVNVPQFENLITLLRQAMPAKLITMDALEGDPATVAAATQSSLDQVNVMCYDMWGGLGPSLSFHNDAIYGNTPFGNAGGCAWRTNRVMIHGIDAAKLGVGIPFYGYRFKGVTGPLQIGQSTPPTSFAYRELVSDPTRWQQQYQFYDDTHKSNYLSISALNEFDSFNGVQFMSDVATWAKSKGFGGFMVFTQDNEYLSNETGDARYPLSTALSGAVFNPDPRRLMKPPPMRPLYIGVALLLVFAIFVVWLREGRSHAGALKRESN